MALRAMCKYYVLLTVSGIGQGSQRAIILCWNSWGSVGVQGEGESQGSSRGLILDQMGISAIGWGS